MGQSVEFDVGSFAKAEATDYGLRIGQSPTVAEKKMKNLLSLMLEGAPVGKEVNSFVTLDPNNRAVRVVVVKTGESTFRIKRKKLSSYGSHY